MRLLHFLLSQLTKVLCQFLVQKLEWRSVFGLHLPTATHDVIYTLQCEIDQGEQVSTMTIVDSILRWTGRSSYGYHGLVMATTTRLVSVKYAQTTAQLLRCKWNFE